MAQTETRNLMPMTCPKCSGCELESHDADSDSVSYWVSQKCQSCGFGWTETYDFVSWEPDEESEGE